MKHRRAFVNLQNRGMNSDHHPGELLYFAGTTWNAYPAGLHPFLLVQQPNALEKATALFWTNLVLNNHGPTGEFTLESLQSLKAIGDRRPKSPYQTHGQREDESARLFRPRAAYRFRG